MRRVPHVSLLGYAVLGALLGAGALPAAEPDAPVIQKVEVTGNTVYDQPRILKIVRLAPGDRLWRSPAEVAESLQQRYRGVGYAAATVKGRFEEGTLLLSVDEGRVGRVSIEGLSAPAAERARRLVDLEPGSLLREQQVEAVLGEVEAASGGALRRAGEPPSFRVTPGAQGADVTLLLEPVRHRLAVRPVGARTAPFFNRVEGFAPWVSATATLYDPVGYNHTRLYGGISYGFASESVRYIAGARRGFGRRGRLVLGFEQHDITDSDDLFRAVGLEEAPAVVLTLPSPLDFHRRYGQEAFAFLRPCDRLQLGLGFRSDHHEPLPVVSDGSPFFSPEPRDNPAAGQGLMRSLLLTARWAHGGPLFMSDLREGDALLVRNPYGTRLEAGNDVRAEGTLEIAAPGLGSTFDFRRFTGDLKFVRPLSARHWLRGRALLGLSSGDLPEQKRLALGGPGTLRGYEIKRFSGEGMAHGSLEIAYRSPGRLPGLVAFYDGGLVWGERAESTWRQDVGLGLEWPAGTAFFVRVELAVPLREPEGDDAWQLVGRVRLPFF